MIELNCTHSFYGKKFIYALLDFDNKPIRFFNYPKENTVKLKVKPIDLNLILGECLL